MKEKCEKISIKYTQEMKKQSYDDFIKIMISKFINNFKYEIDNIMIPYNILEEWLITNGYVVIVYVKKEEILLNRDFYKEGVYMFSSVASLQWLPSVLKQPTHVIINEPSIGLNKRYTIGVDCVLIKNTTNMFSFFNLFKKYATLLCNSEQTQYLVNTLTRSQVLAKAENDSVKESTEKYLRDIEDGALGVILASDDLLENLETSPYYSTTTNYMTQLIEYHQYLKASWLNDLTLNANYNMKRESLTDSEIMLNDDSLDALYDEMFESRKKGMDEVNQMFSTNYQIFKKRKKTQNESEENINDSKIE